MLTNPINCDGRMLIGFDGFPIVIPYRLGLGYTRGYNLVLQGHTLVAVLLEDVHVHDFRNSYKDKKVSVSPYFG